MPPQHVVPFTLPSAEETAALKIVSRYLLRAGTESASKLLHAHPSDTRTILFATYSDSLLHSAALCDGLTSSLKDVARAIDLDGKARMR